MIELAKTEELVQIEPRLAAKRTAPHHSQDHQSEFVSHRYGKEGYASARTFSAWTLNCAR